MRNNLAHCISELIDGNEVLKLKKKGAKDIVFDAEMKHSKISYIFFYAITP